MGFHDRRGRERGGVDRRWESRVELIFLDGCGCGFGVPVYMYDWLVDSEMEMEMDARLGRCVGLEMFVH